MVACRLLYRSLGPEENLVFTDDVQHIRHEIQTFFLFHIQLIRILDEKVENEEPHCATEHLTEAGERAVSQTKRASLPAVAERDKGVLLRLQHLLDFGTHASVGQRGPPPHCSWWEPAWERAATGHREKGQSRARSSNAEVKTQPSVKP